MIFAVVGHPCSPAIIGRSAELLHRFERLMTRFPQPLLHTFDQMRLDTPVERNILCCRLSMVRSQILQEQLHFFFMVFQIEFFFNFFFCYNFISPAELDAGWLLFTRGCFITISHFSLLFDGSGIMGIQGTILRRLFACTCTGFRMFCLCLLL